MGSKRQSEIYSERRKRKTQLYHQHNLPLIELEIHHFDTHRHNQWARRLAKVLQQSIEII